MASPVLSSPKQTPSGSRSAILSPKVKLDDVELSDVQDGEIKQPGLPVEEDIMQCARLGEVGLIQRLFESGKFNARYQDEEGITPLHVRSVVSQSRMTR